MDGSKHKPFRLTLLLSRSRLRGVTKGLLITCWVLGVASLPIDSGSAATLRVTVEEVRQGSQPVRVLLFNSPDSFPDEEKHFKVLATKAAQGVAVVEFTDLDPQVLEPGLRPPLTCGFVFSRLDPTALLRLRKKC